MNGLIADHRKLQLEWKQSYIRHLRKFMLTGHADDLAQAKNNAKCVIQQQPYDIMCLHEETMYMMISHVEINEAMIMSHRSLAYLMESLSVIAAEQDSKEGEELALHSFRDPLLQSAHSILLRQDPRNNYENVLQQMDSAIVLFSEEGFLSFINVETAKILQVARKELVGCTLLDLLRHPLLARDKRKIILRIYRETIVLRKRYHEVTDKQGHTYVVTFTYGDQMDGNYLYSIKDVSDFKRIEHSAVQNDKLAILGKIAAAIAHEIRNPLTSIRGFIQLLRPHLMQLGKDEYARIILAEIDRANDIIYEFLNSSKPTAPFTSVVPITSLIREVIMLTESEALMKGCVISLEEQASDSSILVSIDVKQIKQVFLNMIRNAIDALVEMRNTRAGLIEISAKLEGKYAAVSIRDNGKGMDDRTLERLFDPFFTTKDDGTGLGLSVSYQIIRNHGGTIEVNSKQGEWTEFVIRLPIALASVI
ncbi:ATP-binding protein [Paenibacillus marinisediminis]